MQQACNADKKTKEFFFFFLNPYSGKGKDSDSKSPNLLLQKDPKTKKNLSFILLFPKIFSAANVLQTK